MHQKPIFIKSSDTTQSYSVVKTP